MYILIMPANGMPNHVIVSSSKIATPCLQWLVSALCQSRAASPIVTYVRLLCPGMFLSSPFLGPMACLVARCPVLLLFLSHHLLFVYQKCIPRFSSCCLFSPVYLECTLLCTLFMLLKGASLYSLSTHFFHCLIFLCCIMCKYGFRSLFLIHPLWRCDISFPSWYSCSLVQSLSVHVLLLLLLLLFTAHYLLIQLDSMFSWYCVGSIVYCS